MCGPETLPGYGAAARGFEAQGKFHHGPSDWSGLARAEFPISEKLCGTMT
jgi:hypothetical protein